MSYVNTAETSQKRNTFLTSMLIHSKVVILALGFTKPQLQVVVTRVRLYGVSAMCNGS